MWKWTCPKNHREGFGDTIWEHHSKENALEHIRGHETTSWEPLGITPCDAVHELVDDGEPCDYPNCRFPYIREEPLTNWLTELRYYSSTGKLIEVRRTHSPRSGTVNNTMKTRRRRLSGVAGDPDALTGG